MNVTAKESIVFDRIELKFGNYYELCFHCDDFKLEVDWSPTLEAQGRFNGNILTPEGKQIDGFGGFSVTFPYFGGPYLNKKFEKFSDSEKEIIAFLFPIKKEDDYFKDYAGNIHFDNPDGKLKKIPGKYFNRPSKEFVDLVRQYLPIINRELIAANILAKRFDTVQEREKDVLFLRMTITFWSNKLESAFDLDDLVETAPLVSQIIEYKQSFKSVTGRDWCEEDKVSKEEVNTILES